MKRRVVPFLLVLCMALAWMPGTALAGEPITTLIDLDGKDHLLFENYGMNWPGDDSGPGWSWDSENCVLTLNGYTGKSISSDNMSKIVLADGSVNKLEMMNLRGNKNIDGVELPVTIEGSGELTIYNTEIKPYGTKERTPAFQIGTSTPLSFGNNLKMTGGTSEEDSSPLTFVEHEVNYEGYMLARKYATTSTGKKAFYVRIAPSGSVSAQDKPSENNTANNPTMPVDGGRYSDVVKNAWYYDAIEFVSKPANNSVDYGLMDGSSDTAFAPNSNANRATIITALYRKSGDGYELGNNPNLKFPYSDISRDILPMVLWANDCNITTGYGDGRFGPNDPVTREQFAVFLYRYAQEKRSRTQNEDKYELSARSDLSVYADNAKISSWARDAMSWANARGFITGVTDTTLEPSNYVTRAEVAMILMRAAVI